MTCRRRSFFIAKRYIGKPLPDSTMFHDLPKPFADITPHLMVATITLHGVRRVAHRAGASLDCSSLSQAQELRRDVWTQRAESPFHESPQRTPLMGVVAAHALEVPVGSRLATGVIERNDGALSGPQRPLVEEVHRSLEIDRTPWREHLLGILHVVLHQGRVPGDRSTLDMTRPTKSIGNVLPWGEAQPPQISVRLCAVHRVAGPAGA